MRQALATVIAIASLSACAKSVDDADVAQLAEVLRSDTSPLGIPLQKDRAECLARAYLGSDLSDEALENLKNGLPLAPAAAGDVEAIAEITGETGDCV